MKRLIVLRGNSGSGKTTVAKAVQERLGRKTMLLSQDTLRREILRVKENSIHPTAELMQETALFGWNHGFDTVVVEGVWSSRKNREALGKLIKYADVSLIYYFDIPFEETLRRHLTKPNADDFGEKKMLGWWHDKDFLGVDGEQIIDETYTKDAIVEKILQDVKMML